MTTGHKIQITANLDVHDNIARAGFGFILTCECGLRCKGTRTYLAKVANSHGQKHQYLAFRRDPATYAGA